MATEDTAAQDNFFNSMTKEQSVKLFEALQATGNTYPIVASLALKLHKEDKLNLVDELVKETKLNYWLFTYYGSPIDPIEINSIVCFLETSREKALMKFFEMYKSSKLRESEITEMNGRWEIYKESHEIDESFFEYIKDSNVEEVLWVAFEILCNLVG